MPGTQSARMPASCGVVGGSITTSPTVVPFDPALERARATWTSGEFGRIAAGYAAGAAAFVKRLGLARGESVLDVACGNGNLTLPAAREGATVTGLDIAPNLIDAARRASAAESLHISFDVGVAEALPYADDSFDIVMSMFGVMFSAHPGPALSELLRVTRGGGRVVLASWTPGGFIGAMLRAHVALAPPPPGTPSPLAWGDEAEMQRRLEPHRDRVSSLVFVQRTIELAFPFTPAGVVELFRGYYGPSVRTFAALEPERRAELAAELLRLWSGHNAGGDGSTRVQAEYLEVEIDVA